MAKSSSRSSLVVVLVFVIAGMLLAYAFVRARETSEKSAVPNTYTQPDAGVAAIDMTEEERLAYIEANVTVSGLDIGPNMKPGLDEAVPGLLEVTGTINNDGDRPIDRVFLHVFPKDADGNVIATHIENVAKNGGQLDAGASRAFKFTIPEKKEFGGTFDYVLR